MKLGLMEVRMKVNGLQTFFMETVHGNAREHTWNILQNSFLASQSVCGFLCNRADFLEKPTALFIADAASVRGTAVGTTIPPLTVEVVDSKGQIVSSESGREISASLAYKRSLQLSPRTMRKLSK